eukprot:586868-Hanusia_phi.AAC.3
MAATHCHSSRPVPPLVATLVRILKNVSSSQPPIVPQTFTSFSRHGDGIDLRGCLWDMVKPVWNTRSLCFLLYDDPGINGSEGCLPGWFHAYASNDQRFPFKTVLYA